MATYWENSCSFGLRYVSWYTCLIVSLVFSHLGFWSGNLFLIAPFPDRCLLVPFMRKFEFPTGFQGNRQIFFVTVVINVEEEDIKTVYQTKKLRGRHKDSVPDKETLRYLSIYLPTDLPTYLSFYLSIHPSIYLKDYLLWL